ncbi:hypothetical protein B0O80DRAFT_446227 [Mortierella sp. GBAus27b]|nr:hypothetical protein BGX31_010767 [Mortierella sp. GBA43]KAI8356961.1 hypothetical protein B0O80DRAFT_446227 [Mortierella sp. GBAus27b]
MVKLRVSVGGSYTDLAVFNCNDELHPLEFDGPEFKGRAVVRIKDFVGITSDGSEPIHNSDYFKGHNRRFSIQVEGRFKREWTGDQVYFGTDFDHSVHLPHGFETMFKFAQVIDPVVKSSPSEEVKPWILSPLVSSINILTAWHPQDAGLPSPPLTPRHSTDLARSSSSSTHGSGSSWKFLSKLKHGHHSSSGTTNTGNDHGDYGNQPSPASNSAEHLERHADSPHHTMEPLQSSTSNLDHGAMESTQGEHSSTIESHLHDDAGMPLGRWRQHLEEDTTFFMPDKDTMTTSHRRSYFQSEETRHRFVFKPELVHGFEFFSPYMNFNTGDIKLVLSLNIRKYLNGQPVRYTCRTLDGSTVFWAVQFEFVD